MPKSIQSFLFFNSKAEHFRTRKDINPWEPWPPQKCLLVAAIFLVIILLLFILESQNEVCIF